MVRQIKLEGFVNATLNKINYIGGIATIGKINQLTELIENKLLNVNIGGQKDPVKVTTEDIIKIYNPELEATEPFNETVGGSVSFDSEMAGLFITNDEDPAAETPINLTFTAGAFSLTLKPGESFNERIPPFSMLSFSGEAKFRGYAKKDINMASSEGGEVMQ